MSNRTRKREKQKVTLREAHRLVKDPLFLFKAGEKLKELGLVGEKRNGRIMILAGMARTLPNPPSILVKGSTSSGKSTLVKTCLELFPPACIVERAGLSGKALAHGRGSLAQKILYINEYRCGKDALLLLRLLQSEGQIKHEYTAISGAGVRTKTARRIGMPVVLSTTTDDKVFADDETRFLSIWIDESLDQSREIVLARARKPRIPDRHDLPLWQKAMSLLTYKKGDFQHPPKWLEYVARKLPLNQIRVRRDWDRFLAFCSSVSLWQNVARRGPVDITFQDYCIAHRILEPVLVSAVRAAHSQEHVLTSAVGRLSRHRKAVTVHQIADELGWKESLVYKWIKTAVKKQLIRYKGGTREKNVKRVVPVGDCSEKFLPHPRSVLKHYPELGNKVGFVNPLTGKMEVVSR